MVFSSAVFLFLFLPLALLIYYLSPKNAKNGVLFLLSILFYAWGENIIVLLMLASTVIDYSCGLLIEKGRRKLGLSISIFMNLLFLASFKYLNFAFDNFSALLGFIKVDNSMFQDLPTVLLPIGISFYTFQTMSYTIDVYRGNVKANHNFIEFGAYVTMFPQLIAGPIVRYVDIHNQLRERQVTIEKFSVGVERFIVGLFKKVMIANSCAYVADMVFQQPLDSISTFHAWIGIIAYAFQIYYDFSGYSDMAIGLGKMFGFDIPENFNYPYIATSIRDFWRRWHISLSTWFRDYVYIPLGGSKKGSFYTYRNLLIVFFVTGLWHGASWNFIVWGLFHGFFILIERKWLKHILEKIWQPISHLYLLMVVLVSWVFFRADTLHEAMVYLKKMFIFEGGDESVNSYLDYFNMSPKLLVVFIIATLFSMPIYPRLMKYLERDNRYVFKTAFLLGLFVISVAYVTVDTYNPFIYFRF